MVDFATRLTVPLAFVATSAWFVVSTLRDQPNQAAAGAGLLGIGLPVYWVWKRRVSTA